MLSILKVSFIRGQLKAARALLGWSQRSLLLLQMYRFSDDKATGSRGRMAGLGGKKRLFKIQEALCQRLASNS